tara:strand:- start:34470 stop:34958 length:489 start_codon:yes stop_codon:yes gene_type:complete
MNFIFFDPKDKSDWGDKQAKVSDNINKGLGLVKGFAVIFVRAGTSEFDKIKAMLQKPTSTQRGYYWSVVLPHIRKGAEEHGQCYKNDEDLHYDIKQVMMDQYGVYVERVSQITGEVYREGVSVSDEKGDKSNTAKYLDAVINWAADFYGVIIPEPKTITNKE